MMKQPLKAMWICALISFTIMGCKTESINPLNSTTPPKIYSLSIFRLDSLTQIYTDSIEIGDTLYFQCNADDGEGEEIQDTLNYHWFCELGKYIKTVEKPGEPSNTLWNGGLSVRWTQPEEITGAHPISVKVSDLWHISEYRDTIYVLPEGSFTPPPVIESLSISSDVLEPSDTLFLSCDAIVADTTMELYYYWNCEGGRLLSDSEASTQWIAPIALGTYYIYVEVSDWYHSVMDSIAVTVSPPGTVNHPPVIQDLWAEPAEVALNGSSQITCTAVDRDNNPLSFTWYSSDGEITGNGPRVTWWAPDRRGEYQIRVVVSDGELTTERELSIVVNLLYHSDFSTNQVAGKWAYSGLLANLGDADGFHEIKWDSTNQAMSVTGRSTYGTHAYQLTDEGFTSGEYEIKVMATGTRFGNLGFAPKLIDNRNYLMVGFDFNRGFFQIYDCVDGRSSWKADGWLTLHPNRYYTIYYTQTVDGTGQIVFEGNTLWSGDLPDRFRNPSPLGVVIYGLDDSGAALFDDLKVQGQ